MDFFDTCSHINALLQTGKEVEARNELIRMLDQHEKADIPYTPLVNHLIRQSGLFPYLDLETSTWQERFVYESFKVDIGLQAPVAFHSEQSDVLKHLLEGKDLAVSAPTSFGKSLIIDAFIAIKKPTNVVILVPTIALTDETRRRLNGKFSGNYKIITTADVEPGGRNIFIFPQERALHYYDKIKHLDLLVVDEFYKASQDFDRERSPALLKAMLKLGGIAAQRYYLAPNISELNDNPFTKGMLFLRLDFNTVFLEKHDLYKSIKKDQSKKNDALIQILKKRRAKSLIYAGTYTNVERVSNLLLERTQEIRSELLSKFSAWLAKNYDPNWVLTALAKRGVGIHTGRLHRSLSQIQVRLFEEDGGLRTIVSTSSIIEGVNTSAENVVVWSNKNGKFLLKDFTYRNIIGRGGRMFKHFIGRIYILEEPPQPTDTQLDLKFPDELLADVSETEFKNDLTAKQIANIIEFKTEMRELLGREVFERLQNRGELISSDMSLIKDMVLEIKSNPNHWRGLSFLNSDSTENWGWILHKVLKLSPGIWDCTYTKFVDFVKLLSRNWDLSLPELLDELDAVDIDIQLFFLLERNATFKLTSLLSDLNVLQRELLPDRNIDISPFIAKLSRAFLPSCVYALEEYGLPRMLSKKIFASGIINFLQDDLALHDAIDKLNQRSKRIRESVRDLDEFDHYVLNFFFEGIAKE